MNNFTSYAKLLKPSWAPPAWIFGPVWTFLYALIAISFGAVFYKLATKEIPFIVALPFTYFQFGLKNNALAAVDIFLVLGTIVWAMISIFPHARWITYIQIPYLLWVSFATVLQFTVTFLNR